jgi:hypothetical protein
LVTFIFVKIPFPSFFKTYADNTFISNVIWCPVAIRNFTTDGVLRGIFVPKREEEGVNCVVKSFITCEIHEGL